MSKRSIFVFMTLLLLSGILLMIWISGMHPTFSTPEEAFMDAFGPSTERAIIRDNTFVAISHQATGLEQLVVIDQNGQVVEQLSPDACQQER